MRYIWPWAIQMMNGARPIVTYFAPKLTLRRSLKSGLHGRQERHWEMTDSGSRLNLCCIARLAIPAAADLGKFEKGPDPLRPGKFEKGPDP